MRRAELVSLLGETFRPVRGGLRHIWAVFWAQMKIFLSYKLWVASDIVNTIISITMYYFMSFQIPPERFRKLGYGESYLAFSLLGIATAYYLWACVNRLSHSLQHEIREGTFETVVSSQISLWSYVIGQSARGFTTGLLWLFGSFAAGYALGVRYVTTPATLASAALVFVVMVVALFSLGAASAGVILVYKKGDPLTFFFTVFAEFFSGIMFPLRMLREYPVLEAISLAIPYTHGIEALRRILILGETLASPAVWRSTLILLCFSILFIPISILSFKWGYNKVRQLGETATY